MFYNRKFQSIREVEIFDSSIMIITKFTFSGLKHLKYLTLKNVSSEFQSEFLSQIPNLREFQMTDCPFDEISLDILFGTDKLEFLEKIVISNCNLMTTIHATTFSALNNIVELKLTANNIEQIESGAFDGIFDTLKLLDLNENLLKTLPNDIFPSSSNIVSINLSENPWHCTCNLEHLRKLIAFNETKLHISQIICQSPPNYMHKDLSQLSTLCEIFVPENAIVKPPIFPGNTGHQELAPNEVIEIVHCGPIQLGKNFLLEKPSIEKFPSIRTNKGKLVLYSAHLYKKFSYFAYETRSKTFPKCISNTEDEKSEKVEIELKPNHMYRLCRIARPEKFHFIPLDCIPFNSGMGDESFNAWIPMEFKTTVIVICTLVIIFMPFIGIMISFILAKYFPKYIWKKLLKEQPSTRISMKERKSNHGFRSVLLIIIIRNRLFFI